MRQLTCMSANAALTEPIANTLCAAASRCLEIHSPAKRFADSQGAAKEVERSAEVVSKPFAELPFRGGPQFGWRRRQLWPPRRHAL